MPIKVHIAYIRNAYTNISRRLDKGENSVTASVADVGTSPNTLHRGTDKRFTAVRMQLERYSDHTVFRDHEFRVKSIDPFEFESFKGHGI